MSSLRNNKYSYLGLETNPFPFTPVPRRPWILGGKSRIEACNKIKNEIILSKSLNEPKINIILGDLGEGKTHIAEYLVNYSLSSKQYKIFVHSIQDPMNKPTLSFLAIKAINSLGGESFLKELSEKIILKTLKRNLEKIESRGILKLGVREKILCLMESNFKKQKIKEIIETLEGEPETIQRLMKKGTIDDESLIKLVEEEIRNAFDTDPRSVTLRNFVDLNIFREIILFPFSGYWKYYSKNRYGELVNKISKSEEDALKFVSTLVNLMKYISEETVVLIIDEIDALSPLENVNIFFHSLRELVDRGPGSFYILLLCVPRTWNSYLEHDQLGNVHAIRSRIGTKPIILGPISLDEAIDIINKYLGAVSFTKEDKLYEKIFEPGTIELLYRKSSANIRQLLVFCFHCIEYISQNKLSKVSYDVIEKVLGEVGIPESQIPSEISLEPDSDITKQIIKEFFSIEKPLERGKLLEKAVSEIISKGLGKERNLGKRRVSTGLKRRREIDILFYDTMQRECGIEVKAYNKERIIEPKQIEGFIELIKGSPIENFILISTSEISIDAKREIDKVSKQKSVKINVLDEKQLATILYATNTFTERGRPELARQVELKKEEAISLLKSLGII